MDSHALLTSQGWRGTGHSLHASNDRIGLARPLLVAQKQNTLGIGKKQHKTSDMWWMNAFDKSLKGLDTSVAGNVVQTVNAGGLDMVAKGGAKWVGSGGGLYESFVRGEVLGGTIGENKCFGIGEGVEVVKTVVEIRTFGDDEERSKKKRRVEEDRMESKEERRARKEKKRAKRAKEAAAAEQQVVEMIEEQSTTKVESKEERKLRRQQKKLRKEAEQLALEKSEKAAKKKKKHRKD